MIISFLILTFCFIVVAYSYQNVPKKFGTNNNRLRVLKENVESADIVQLFFSESAKIGLDISKESDSSIQRANSIGRKLLEEIKRPYGKDEAWRHNNLRKLFSHVYQKSPNYKTIAVDHLIDDSCRNSCLIFIDGKFAPHLSKLDKVPNSIKVGSLLDPSSSSILNTNSKMLDYIPDVGELARNSFGSDLLTALNLAQIEDAACVIIPDNINVDVPIQILFCSTASVAVSAVASNQQNLDVDARASYPRLLVSVGEGSSLKLKQSMITILDSEVAQNVADDSSEIIVNPSFVNSNTRILLANNSRLIHTYAQDLSLTSRHIEVLSSEVSCNASYEVCFLQTGAEIGRINVHINLTSSNANCTLYGVSLAGKRQSLDMHSNIAHDARAANSVQEQRNVIADRGEVIFKGRIRIPKHAQLTDSDQLCRSIMLGQRARVIAMPTLEITADNVVCSHGASVSDLDENSMFYLAARGIDRQEARKLLLRGFVFDLLQDHIIDSSNVEKIINKLERMYPKLEGVPTGSAQKFTSM